MPVNLRPYQERAVQEVIDHINDRPVLVSAVGSGKSVMLAAIVQRLGLRTLILAHRREIVGQLASHLKNAGLTCGLIQAGNTPRPDLPVQVASIQTLNRRTKPPADLVIQDEVHHAVAKTHERIYESYPTALRMGCTATAFRTDGRGLGSMFGRIVIGATASELCADGTLVAPTVFVPGDPDLRRVRMLGGDYDKAQAAAIMDRPKLVADIVEQWRARALGMKTVVFATNVSHSIHLRDRFRESGVSAEHFDGKTSIIDRAKLLARFRSGEITVLCNVDIISEGFDLPDLQVAVIARPTASLVWPVQAIGRIMRASPAKLGTICLDHAANHLRLGEITAPLPHSLDDISKPLKTDSKAPPVKRCKQCFLLVPASIQNCPECGYAFIPETKIPKEHDGTLVAYAPAVAVPFATKSAAWDRIEAQRLAFGFKEGWSFYRYRAAFGESPTVHDGRLIDPAAAPETVRQAEYARLSRIAQEKGYKPGWIGFKFKAKFHTWPTYRDREAS